MDSTSCIQRFIIIYWSRWNSFSHSLPSSDLPPPKNNAQKPSKSPVSMMSEPPTLFVKRPPKPEDPTWSPTSPAWNTTTRWKPTAGLASAWLPKSIKSKFKDADHLYQFLSFLITISKCINLNSPLPKFVSPLSPIEIILFWTIICLNQKILQK